MRAFFVSVVRRKLLLENEFTVHTVFYCCINFFTVAIYFFYCWMLIFIVGHLFLLLQAKLTVAIEKLLLRASGRFGPP